MGCGCSITALGRQRQAELCKFKASLVYRATSSTAKATKRNPVSIIQKERKARLKEYTLRERKVAQQLETYTALKDVRSLSNTHVR